MSWLHFRPGLTSLIWCMVCRKLRRSALPESRPTEIVTVRQTDVGIHIGTGGASVEPSWVVSCVAGAEDVEVHSFKGEPIDWSKAFSKLDEKCARHRHVMPADSGSRQ